MDILGKERLIKLFYHLMIRVSFTVLLSNATDTASDWKNSLVALLSSASTAWGEKNLTVGLDLVPLQRPKCIKGFTLGRASWKSHKRKGCKHASELGLSYRIIWVGLHEE